jgi:hypothetical protein
MVVFVTTATFLDGCCFCQLLGSDGSICTCRSQCIVCLLPVAVVARCFHNHLLMLSFRLFVDCCEVVAAADAIVIVATNVV